MKRTKRAITLLLVLALSIGLLGVPASASYSDWAADELKEAVELGLVPEESEWDYRQNITRQEFAGLMVSLYELLHGSVAYEYETPFTDVDDVYVSTSYSLGIVSGMGNGTFAPDQEITREQMAVMLHNLLSRMFYEEPVTNNPLKSFNDANNISGWAYDAAAFITEHGIIQGYSGGFHPKENASREVAVIVAKRVAVNYLDNFGEPLNVILNGYDYALNGRPVWDGENLWLPGSELLSLMNICRVENSGTWVAAQYFDENETLLQCMFSDGQHYYSTDARNEVLIWSDEVPYFIGGEIYITENMFEDVFGDVIGFDRTQNAIEIYSAKKDLAVFQAGNDNLLSALRLKDIGDLGDSRINSVVSGIVKDDFNWDSWADELYATGFTRDRITVNFSDAPAVNMDYAYIEQEMPEFWIGFFADLKEAGIKVRYCLNFWDMEYRLSGGIISRNRLSTEDEMERYIEYVTMVVTSLKGSVDSYELWNEPDANYDMYQRIRPEDYIEMAKRVIPKIKEIDPEAKVVLASTSSYIEKECREYSMTLLSSDVVALADAISLHTVNNDASPEFKSSYYYGYDDMWDEIKTTAELHGFTGEYIADELNYRSFYSLNVLQPEPNDYHPYEPEVAAKYIARMILINRGMEVSVGASGTDSISRPSEGIVYRNLAFMLDGLNTDDINISIETSADPVRYYTFSDQYGNSYLAIWNDNTAVPDCERNACDITLPGRTATRVTALDSFNSVQQELVFENNGNGLVLSDVMLPDYPLIIRIQ